MDIRKVLANVSKADFLLFVSSIYEQGIADAYEGVIDNMTDKELEDYRLKISYEGIFDIVKGQLIGMNEWQLASVTTG